jgi:hypothetical protein
MHRPAYHLNGVRAAVRTLLPVAHRGVLAVVVAGRQSERPNRARRCNTARARAQTDLARLGGQDRDRTPCFWKSSPTYVMRCWVGSMITLPDVLITGFGDLIPRPSERLQPGLAQAGTRLRDCRRRRTRAPHRHRLAELMPAAGSSSARRASRALELLAHALESCRPPRRPVS